MFSIIDTPHLFWGKYPYRAVVKMPRDQAGFQSLAPYYVACRQQAKSLLNVSPDVKKRVEGNKISFFFYTANDLGDFVADNFKYVTSVTKPLAASHTILLDDPTVRVRKTMFFGKYRWKMTMRTQAAHYTRNEVLDSWIEDYFGITEFTFAPNTYVLIGRPIVKWAETDRVRYNYYHNRVIYLADLTDAVAVKIGLSDHISSVVECVLKNEVSPTDF